MTYLIILYATYIGEKPSKKAMYDAEDYPSAVASFHGYMNTYMKDPTVKHVMCTVIDEKGNPRKTEYFDREVKTDGSTED